MASIDPSAVLLEGSIVSGDVDLGARVSVWHNAVLRGDVNSISVGRETNIQDNCVVHVSPDAPVRIGRRVTLGHGAIVHGCTIGDNVLVGMGSIVMDHAQVGENCIIGAGALLTQGKVVPAGSLVLGSPAKVVRRLSPEEIEGIAERAREYVACAQAACRQAQSQSPCEALVEPSKIDVDGLCNSCQTRNKAAAIEN